MTWLLTDQQLAELHQKLDMDECSSMDKILDVVKEMNISAEIIQNWCEHIFSKSMSEQYEIIKEHLGESI